MVSFNVGEVATTAKDLGYLPVTILLKISCLNYQRLNLALRAKEPLEYIARIVRQTEESIKVNDSLKGRPVFSEVFQMERHESFHFSFVIFGFPR